MTDFNLIRKVYGNFLQMMEDRDCLVMGLHTLPLRDDHIKDELSKPMILMNRFCLKENPTVEGISFFTNKIKYDKSFSDSLLIIGTAFNVRHIVVINLTPSNSKYDDIIERYANQGVKVEIFDYSEFLVGISNLHFDNKYKKCTSEEKQEITLIYGQGAKLLIMKNRDRVAKWLGAKKGDLIQVETPSNALPWVEENGKKVTLYDLLYYYVI